MDLLKGIAVVIDDGIGGEPNIDKIIAKVLAKGIPTAEFKDIQSAEKCIHNFLTVNFIILDWKMVSAPVGAPIGVGVGQGLVAATELKVVEFIKKLKKHCFAPIFIFTNENPVDVLAKLREAGLYFDQEGRDFIYVRSKNDILQDDNLFTETDQWIHKTPSIYILKVWDGEFLKAKNELFWDLYKKSNGCWPKVLWEHYESEKETPYSCINEVIFQLISSRVSLKGIEKEKITGLAMNPELSEIKDIFRKIMFQDGELCSGTLEGVKPGDIFKNNDKYFLNIRPECDTASYRQGRDNIYVICGTKVPNANLKDLNYIESGLIPKINEDFVWLLDGDGVVKFSFNEVEWWKFEENKGKRLCRLLPPYITNIQQRFSSYLGRFGVPRLPKAIEKDILKIEATTTPAT
ncbi:MAG: hypothetical protein V2A65_08940 [Candidatus Omnitrophota bacterium]